MSAEKSRPAGGGSPITPTASSDSTSIPSNLPLSKWHRDELIKGSAIDAEVIRERGYCTVERPNENHASAWGAVHGMPNAQGTTATVLRGLGFPAWATREPYFYPGLWLPQYSPRGDRRAGQWKPKAPVSDRNGKKRKYASATGSTGLDVHPRWSKDRGQADAGAVPAINDAAEPLWITEGIKKGDSLTSRGVVTVALAGVYNFRSNHGTLGDWEDVKLRGREVTICFDSDATSKPAVARAMARLGKWLRHMGAKSVLYVVPPPEVNGAEVKGVDDYFAAGGTLAELEALRRKKPIEAEELSDTFTDTVLAQVLADEALEGAYVWAKGIGWLGWNGRVWQEATEAAIGEVIRQWAHDNFAESAAALAEAGINGNRSAVDGWHKVLSRVRRDAILKDARGIMEMNAGNLDADPDILNTPAGIVDLRTGKVLAHDPYMFCTKISAGSYVPGYSHKDWEQALEALRPDAREWYQTRIGQAITGYTSPDGILPILQGGGENGKSAVSTDGLVPALGDYAAPASPKLLASAKNESSTERADLRGQRLVVIEELTEGRSIDVAALKGIADVGKIKARKLYQDNVSFTTSHSLIATTNYVPVVAETDHGTWRRLALVSFPYTWRKAGEPLEGPDDRRGDERLKARITSNASGQHDAIVTWAVEGAKRWYAWQRAVEQAEAAGEPAPVSPMAVPASVEADTLGWRKQADRILGFWTDYIVAEKDAMVEAKELLDHFNAWLAENGHNAWTKETFAAKFGQHRETKRSRVEYKRGPRDHSGIDRRPRGPYEVAPPALPARPWVWVGVRFRRPQEPAQAEKGL